MAEYSITGSGYGGRYTQNMPAYKQPKYDQEKIGLYTQQQMAPGLARLRRGLTSTGAMYSENPAERDAMYRQLMAGYGQGLGELQAGATRAAQGLYEQEYTGLEKQAQRDYERGTSQWDIWRREEARKEGLRDPRGPHPPSYSSWDEYDRAVAMARPTGGTTYANLPFSSGGARPLGLPGTDRGEYNAPSSPTGITYGAGSEEAYKRAIREGELATGLGSWDLGGGKSGLSLLDSYKGFNPYA